VDSQCRVRGRSETVVETTRREEREDKERLAVEPPGADCVARLVLSYTSWETSLGSPRDLQISRLSASTAVVERAGRSAESMGSEGCIRKYPNGYCCYTPGPIGAVAERGYARLGVGGVNTRIGRVIWAPRRQIPSRRVRGLSSTSSGVAALTRRVVRQNYDRVKLDRT
jgi:hypothetical protein